MGHTYTRVITDAGLPAPAEVAWRASIWRHYRASRASCRYSRRFHAEFAVKSVTVAHDIHQHNSAMVHLSERLRREDVSVEEVSHAVFKQRCAQAVAMVRTGETAPYASMVLQAGVTF